MSTCIPRNSQKANCAARSPNDNRYMTDPGFRSRGRAFSRNRNGPAKTTTPKIQVPVMRRRRRGNRILLSPGTSPGSCPGVVGPCAPLCRRPCWRPGTQERLHGVRTRKCSYCPAREQVSNPTNSANLRPQGSLTSRERTTPSCRVICRPAKGSYPSLLVRQNATNQPS